MNPNIDTIFQKIQSLKCDDFVTAWARSISVVNADKLQIGRLVPVGNWILQDREKIQLIQEWRQKYMKMFLSQFENSYDKAYGYLKNLSIGLENRIFFLLYDADGRFVGHMGISNVDPLHAELDNFMRGIGGGNPKLVFFAELALIQFVFNELDLELCDLRLLSFNWMVIKLHKEVGFIETQTLPLRRETNNEGINHHFVSINDSNVDYHCKILELHRENFDIGKFINGKNP